MSADSLNLRINLASGMLYTQGERVGYILYHLVQVETFLFEYSLLSVEHRHLQNLFYKESQTF